MYLKWKYKFNKNILENPEASKVSGFFSLNSLLMMNPYITLAIAIVLETIATSALKYSDQFSKIIPTIVCIIGYLGSFYFLSVTLKSLPVGIAYAIWSGAGIVIITTIGYFVFHQKLDLPAILGIILILIGVLLIQLFSKSNA